MTSAAVLLEECRINPAFFAEELLGVQLWEKQVAILESVRDNRRTAVASGHNVGKTFNAAVAMLWFLYSFPRAKVIATAPTFPQVHQRLWNEVKRRHRLARVPLGGRVLDASLRINDEGWEAIALSTDRPDAFQGAHEEHVLIVFDEAQGVAPEIWHAAESMMGSEGARWLCIANPIYTTGEFHSAFHGKRHLWHTMHVSCLDHPNVIADRAGEPRPYPAAVTAEWCDQQAHDWGETSGYYQSRVLGQFPAEGEDTLVPLSLLEKTCEMQSVLGASGMHMGVDVARFGTDQNVCAVLDCMKLVRVEKWGGMNLMETAGRVLHLAREMDIPESCVHVDVIGLGAGVVDRLRESDFCVDAVGFGEQASGEWSDLIGDMPLRNRRAELYWALRLLLRDKRLILPREFGPVWSELTQIRYSYDPASGKLTIEPKDKIKERIGRSPDHADAVTLALSRGGSSRPFAFVL